MAAISTCCPEFRLLAGLPILADGMAGLEHSDGPKSQVRCFHATKPQFTLPFAGDQVVNISRNCVGVTLATLRNARVKALWS